MHELEPHYGWRHHYTSEEDALSPFYGQEYSEFYFSQAVYNYYIHPQWDSIDSNTLFVKVLFAEYEEGIAIIELIGEWNDTLHNDIMHLKRNLIDELLRERINKFIIIGENVMNFHYSDEEYYAEWFEDVEDGWICFLNFREHVLKEFEQADIDSYIVSGGRLQDIAWRTYTPTQLYQIIERIVRMRLGE